jgi:hypothetical protein
MGLLTPLFLLLGCTRYVSLLENEKGDYYFQSKGMRIQKAWVVSKKMGLVDKVEVTHGVRFSLVYPRIKISDLEKLEKRYNVNSWVIRVVRTSALGDKVLGYFYSPVFQPGRFGLKRMRARQMKSIEFFILYSSLYRFSKKLRKSPCLINATAKRIDEFELVPQKEKQVRFTFGKNLGLPLEEKLSLFSYSVIDVNGGRDLTGNYVVEVAPFDLENKRPLINWVRAAGTIKVKKQSNVPLYDCENWRPAPPKVDYRDWRRFKWQED